MARGKARRPRSRLNTRNGRTINRQAPSMGLDAGVVPRVLLGAVDGVGIVAVGALQLARDVLVSAVSGAANIGGQALMATVAGTRGVVSATSQAVADIAEAAQGTLGATIDNVRYSRRGAARLSPRHATASTNDEGISSVTSPGQPPARQRTRGPRLMTRRAHPTGV